MQKQHVNALRNITLHDSDLSFLATRKKRGRFTLEFSEYKEATLKRVADLKKEMLGCSDDLAKIKQLKN